MEQVHLNDVLVAQSGANGDLPAHLNNVQVGLIFLHFILYFFFQSHLN